jgi:hypothetical protein
METLPKDIQDIIFRYKQDLELLASIPKPEFYPHLYLPNKSTQTLNFLLLKRFTNLLFSDSFDLTSYIENFYEVPLSILHDYQTMLLISKQRYKLWKIPYDTAASDLRWNETIIRLLSQFLLLNNNNAA